MAAFAGRKNTKALIVLKDGRIVLERYYGTFTADSSWYWASAGKSLTATLVGIARQDGFMDLNAKSSTYLGRGWTSLSAQREDSIKLIHHMSMSTGLDERLQNPSCTTPACLTYKAPVGTRWYYDNQMYLLVQDMILAATGARNLSNYTNTKLATAGIQGLWFDNVFYSKPRSMARFGLLALAKGNWAGTAILSDTGYFRQMTTTSQLDNPSYGLLWWLNGKASYKLPTVNFPFSGSIIPSAPADMFAALGKNDQKIHVVPSQGIVVVRMGNEAGNAALALTEFDDELWQYLNTAINCATATSSTTPKSSFYIRPSMALVGQPLSVHLPPGTLHGTLRLCNLAGTVLWQGTVADGAILPTAGLAQGMFVAQLAANGAQWPSRFVIAQ